MGNKMVLEIFGHIFQLIGIFFAFLAAIISFIYAQKIFGGLAGKASMLLAIGITIIALDIFVIYTGAITGQFELENSKIFLSITGMMTFIGFSIIAYSQFKLLKVME
jgi:hypothetical protein